MSDMFVIPNTPSAGSQLAPDGFCGFIVSPVSEGSTFFGDHRGSILLNRAETSWEG